MVAKDQLSDPFAVATDHHKRQKTNTTVYSLPNPNTVLPSKGDSSTPSQTEKLSEPAANSFEHPIIDRSGLFTDTFGNSKPTLNNKSYDTNKEYLKIRIRYNPPENSLHWSPRLH